LPTNLKTMFSPLPVPACFSEKFPTGSGSGPARSGPRHRVPPPMMPAVVGLAERVRELEIPVTIMAGSEDRIVGPESHAQWLHDQIPDSDLQIIPDAGHMVHYAAPLQVSAAIDTVSQKATRLLGEPVA
jgi:pimeloyl-ACP methyl ester carboxylesterase